MKISKSFYFTNGCTIYLFRGTLKFTLKYTLCAAHRTHTTKDLTQYAATSLNSP